MGKSWVLCFFDSWCIYSNADYALYTTLNTIFCVKKQFIVLYRLNVDGCSNSILLIEDEVIITHYTLQVCQYL